MGTNTSKNTEIDVDTNRLSLDPRSPDVNRTPISILSNRVTTLTPSTPKSSSNPNNTFEKRKSDPRSPSQFIPRTPLNIKFDKIENNSAAQYSLDYSGCVEEASCRKFNARLADITFDNLFAETQSDRTAVEEAISEEQIVMNVFTDVGEDISPHIHTTTTTTQNTRQNQFTFSSTPISTLNTNELQAKIRKKQHNALECVTPTKKMGNIKEVRTPFGSLLNRRSKSFENLQHQLPFKAINDNDENSTPKIKKMISKASGIRMTNQIFCD